MSPETQLVVVVFVLFLSTASALALLLVRLSAVERSVAEIKSDMRAVKESRGIPDA